jgi:hypothetical protein
MRPDGFPVWVGEVEPGSVHDLICAQEHALAALYAAAARGNRTYNMLLRALRGIGERGFALLVGR